MIDPGAPLDDVCLILTFHLLGTPTSPLDFPRGKQEVEVDAFPAFRRSRRAVRRVFAGRPK